MYAYAAVQVCQTDQLDINLLLFDARTEASEDKAAFNHLLCLQLLEASKHFALCFGGYGYIFTGIVFLKCQKTLRQVIVLSMLRCLFFLSRNFESSLMHVLQFHMSLNNRFRKELINQLMWLVCCDRLCSLIIDWIRTIISSKIQLCRQKLRLSSQLLGYITHLLDV